MIHGSGRMRDLQIKCFAANNAGHFRLVDSRSRLIPIYSPTILPLVLSHSCRRGARGLSSNSSRNSERGRERSRGAQAQEDQESEEKIEETSERETLWPQNGGREKRERERDDKGILFRSLC